MRILVTGSRTWADWGVMENALKAATCLTPAMDVTVINGDAPGADVLAQRIAEKLGMWTEVHPANWTAYGKRAGYLRNARMVNRGADLCLAFIRDNSKGASMCADLAEKAGIETIRYRYATPQAA